MTNHLIELRARFIKILLSFIFLFVLFFYFANPLYHILALPLLSKLPHGGHMIATSVASPLWIPMKFAFYLAIFFSAPFFLYQAWAFIAPGLYPTEKLFIWPLVMASSLLFFCGVIFAYLLVLPLLFGFFVNAVPNGVVLMADIGSYLDFVMRMFLAFGIAFQIPLIMWVSIKAGFLTEQKLQYFRPYAIVIAFILGMLLTPPDVMSQIVLAVPLCLLYELGIFMAKWSTPQS